MNLRAVLLFLMGLALSSLAAGLQAAPGYMDADYYMLGAERIASGHGFTDPVLWNYLDDPAGLPHPSHGYWMPAASLAAAFALLLPGPGGFDQAQWTFVLLAALVPPLTAALSDRLHHVSPAAVRSRAAWLAGLLALFPGYYLGFLTTTDSFALVMVLGASFFLAASSERLTAARRAFVLGVLAGLLHLSRTDGLLWLLPALLAVWWAGGLPRSLLWAPAGYLLVMLPWFLRNLSVFGTVLAPGGARAFWWVRYEDLFAFPAELLTPARWLVSGPAAILAARAEAGWLNVQSSIAVGGLVFLFPLMVAGLWRLRNRVEVRAGLVAWFLVFVLMSIVFPFAGSRGGYFHAAATVQPLLWATVPEGLEAFIAWGRRVRGWNAPTARKVFGAGLVILAAVVTGYLGWTRFAAPATQAGSGYLDAEDVLQGMGAAPTAIVMVNNPPGFYRLTGRPAIVIPDGGGEPILAAAARFGAEYLVLGPEQGLPELYDHPSAWPGLELEGQAGELKIFRFTGPP